MLKLTPLFRSSDVSRRKETVRALPSRGDCLKDLEKCWELAGLADQAASFFYLTDDLGGEYTDLQFRITGRLVTGGARYLIGANLMVNLDAAIEFYNDVYDFMGE